MTLSYRAPAQCPSRAEFLREVQRSTARMQLVTDDAAGTRRFEVFIADDGLAGKLSIDSGAGVRETRGSNCAEVSRLLAFATALAVDPDSTRKGDETPPPSEPARVKEPNVAPATRAARVAPRNASHALLGGSVGAFGSVEGASAPNPSFGGGGFGELQLLSLGLRPLVRVGLGFAESADASVPGTSATVSFSDAFALLDACPTTLGSGRWSLYPCARFEGERVTARPSRGVPSPSTAHEPQLELGLLARARARLGSGFFADLAGGALVPVLRHSIFVRNVDPKVHQVPVLAAFGEFSLGVEFR